MALSQPQTLPDQPRFKATLASLPVTVEWITRVADIESLAPEWTGFEQNVQDRTVFSTFGFLTTWYGNYAGPNGGDPLIGIARRGGKLVGVAPLVTRRGLLGKIPVTRLQFAMHDAYSGEFLVEDDHPETITAFLDSLACAGKFDLVSLNGIEPESDRFRALEDSAKRHRLAIERTNHPNAIVDLKNGYEGYCRQMSKNFRRTLKRQAQRVTGAGTPAVEGVQLMSGVDRLESHIDRLIAVTEASYKLKGQRLADCHRNYLGKLARDFGPRGMLHLSILSINGRDAAVVMGLVERGCYYDVTLAYAEEFAELSPGAYLMQEVLSDLAARGVHTLISHGAHEYKRRWSTAFVPSTRVFLFSRTRAGLLSRFVRFRMAPVWQRFGAEDP
ncbi:MAG TPA: GNAT family N-acetyltransferase [Terriglobia bacterium]|nr:GNAT family N-acetyltransferase [Terriglobia bacterium]